jgi:pyruvate/2-oxoglutarate/acetoin dehydrogenase E1 component
MTRQLKFSEAILEATDQCMSADPKVYLMGLGVTDPKGTFGTTLGLEAKYGRNRVMDMPTSENAMTGIAIGSALTGMRPLMTHQRVDFVLLALDQILNNAAKWHYMFGGRMRVPFVIRLMIGRGWGQGPQHSQSLQSVFGHFPGLKVVMPATPHDAKGLLVAAVKDDNPVVYMEHRWLHGISGPVPEDLYAVPIGEARIARGGRDVTIVATSYMTLEALRAADRLAELGIDAEVLDLRTIRPLDENAIVASVSKTGRLIVADLAWKAMGVGAEIVAVAAERALGNLKQPPRRITFPDCPSPTSPALAKHFFPRAAHIVDAAKAMLGVSDKTDEASRLDPELLDVPDPNFRGPF